MTHQHKQTFWFIWTLLCFIIVAYTMAVVMFGCKTVEYKNTVIRDTIVTVVPTVIRDTIQGVLVNDTAYIDRVNYRHDTIIKIRYSYKTKQATVYVKPDTVRLSRTDTLTVYNQPPTEQQKTPKVWLAAGLLAIAGVLFYIYNKFKQ